MTGVNIAIIGECMIEISGELLGTTQQSYGGDTYNTAYYLKQLAGQQIGVSYLTAMGSDPLSEVIISKWRAQGINCQYVLRNSNKHAGLYLIQNDESGERYFQYWRNDSAARYLMRMPDIETVFGEIANYQAVYLSGISLAILPPTDKVKLLDALRQLKTQGVKIVFDSNYRPGLWDSVADTMACYEQLYNLADLALLTLEDEQKIWYDADLKACQKRLQQYGITELIIKDGPNGCHYFHTGDVFHFKTQRISSVVDTTAAGDSFNAGYLSGWLLKQSAEKCAELGNRLAGQVIQQKGAIVPIDVQLLTQ